MTIKPWHPVKPSDIEISLEGHVISLKNKRNWGTEKKIRLWQSKGKSSFGTLVQCSSS